MVGSLQSGAVYVIIVIFVGIAAREMYSMWKEKEDIRKIKHNKKLKEIEKGE
jgi:hypothetical protein